jgi:hypothetical protein
MPAVGATTAVAAAHSAKAAAPLPGVGVDELPPILARFVSRLEAFADANLRDAKRDQIFFWGLKTPIVVSSAAASISAFSGLTTLSGALAMLAALVAGIDALYPRGALRNAHWSAYHTIRALANDIVDEWAIGVSEGKNPKDLEAFILRKAMKKRAGIANKVRDAEASLGTSPSAEKS